MKFLKIIFNLFNKKEKIKSVQYCFYFLLNSSLELLILASVLPLTQLISTSVDDNFFSNLLINYNYNHQVYIAISLIAFLYLVKNSFYSYFTFWLYSFFSSIEKRYGKTLFESYIHKKYEFYKKNNSSYLINKVTESGAIGSILKSLCSIITESFVLLFLIAFLIFKEPIVTITMISFFLLIAVISGIYFKKKIRFWGAQQLNFNALVKKYLMQYFEGIKDVKVFAKENIVKEDFDKTITKAVDYKIIFEIFSQMPKIVFETISVFSFCLLIYLVIFFKIDANLIELTAIFVAATFRIMPSISRINTAFYSIQNSFVLVSQIIGDINNIDPINNERKVENHKQIIFNQNVIFNNLKFKFQDSDKYLLKDVNFKINKGETIGILGESGSGKSTFGDIFAGLIDNYEGKILVDDLKLTQDYLKSWKKKIGYIQQSVFLFDDTIKNNIIWKDIPNFDKLRFEEAIENSNLGNFINSLADGLDTSVGERGTRISGGQRQRLSIARTLYKNPEIIIWDEATSALDKDNEMNIYNLIYHKLNNKTNIIITHKEALLNKCDKIYDLNKNGQMFVR